MASTGSNACGSSSPRSKSRSPSPGLGLPGDAETGELLEQICTQLSEETTAELVDIANSTVVQQRMQDMLPIYFYSWKLRQPVAIIIYLLLQFFLVKRDSSDLRKDKEECETHIYKLKQKIGDLEEQLRAKSPPSINSESSTDSSVEISKLEKEIEQLSLHNQQLQNTKAELYDINQQWANDYGILAQQIANTSGCYSANSTGTQSHSVPAVCIQCRRLERELDERKTEIEQLQADFERTREELQELQQSLEQRNSQLHQLENENRAIHFQLQELGDLQHAMKVQEEHGKLQHQYAQLKKDHQNGVAERLQLIKQLEKVRKAVLAIFPMSSTVNGRGRSTSGYNTVPKRSCRRQHYSAEPPTPPGLIARGDNRGSLVEKDLRLRMMHADQQVTGFEASTSQLGLDEPHTWPGAIHVEPAPRKAKPSALFPVRNLQCPCCQRTFACDLEDFNRWFEHIQFCGI